MLLIGRAPGHPIKVKVSVIDKKMSEHNLKRVAVIGAGISGVVSAGHLIAAGLDVTVFERSEAAGGVW